MKKKQKQERTLGKLTSALQITCCVECILRSIKHFFLETGNFQKYEQLTNTSLFIYGMSG